MEDKDIVRGEDVPSFETVDGVKYKCMSTPKSLSQTLDEIVAFNPNSGVLYPGALVKGTSLKDGVLNPISITRNGGKLTISYINFENKETKHTEIVEQATFQNYQEAFSKLVRNLPDGKQVARITFEKQESYELQETLLKLGLSVTWLKASMKAQLENSFKSNKAKYFVKVVQPYYDISFETNFKKNQEPADFFAKNNNVNNVLKAIGDTSNNPPAYVKSISYGRMLLLFIESESSQKVLTTALEAIFSGTTVKGKLSLNAEQINAVQNSKINLLSLGGAADATVKLISGNKLDSLVTYLKDGANFSKESPGFPLTYVTRYLKNNDVAKLSYATNYDVKKCDKNPRKITRVDVDFMNIMDNKDKGEGVTFTVFKGDQIIGEQKNIGVNVNWAEGSNDGWKISIGDGLADEFDRNIMRVNISKSGDKGFSCKPTIITVYFTDGTKEEWARLEGAFIMGDGHSNSQTFNLRK